MPAPKQEKRTAPRLQLQIPVKVRVKNGSAAECEALTRDISRNGLFLYADRELKEGSELEMVLLLPPEVAPNGQQTWVCARGHVVRVEQNSERGVSGVAAVMERYVAVPEA